MYDMYACTYTYVCITYMRVCTCIHIIVCGARLCVGGRGPHTITPHTCVHPSIHTYIHHITSHHLTSHHITSNHHITSHHLTSHHITSRHVTSRHVTSHHTTPHHITYITVYVMIGLNRVCSSQSLHKLYNIQFDDDRLMITYN